MKRVEILTEKVSIFFGVFDVIRITDEVRESFLKDWTDEQIVCVKRMIKEYVLYSHVPVGGSWTSFLGTQDKINEIFGLPYNSGGGFAVLSAAVNNRIYLRDSSLYNGFYIYAFVLMETQNGLQLVMLCKDKEERYIGVILQRSGRDKQSGKDFLNFIETGQI